MSTETKAAPIIKYRTGYGTSAKIERVEVLRETAGCVYLPSLGIGRDGSGRRALKNSSYETYHDSWADAHAHLMKRAEGAVGGARHQLELANSQLGNIKGMKPPKESA